jgi:single-stranded DNA-binding protein
MQENTCHEAGYLAARPTVGDSPKGTPVANARIGQTSRFTNEGGIYSEHTNWFMLVFWVPLAQALADAGLENHANLWPEGSFEERQYSRKANPKQKYMVCGVIVRKLFLIALVRIEGDRREEQAVSAAEAQNFAPPTPSSNGKKHWPT